VLVTLALVALVSYWWPRRLQQHVVGLTIVVAMVVIGAVLATASLTPCRGRQSYTAVFGWVLNLYVGNPPPYPNAGCTGQPPLALQLAGVVCLGATLVGALTVAAVLWRQPVDRFLSRMVRDAVIFTGLDAMTIPFLEQLARTGRPASIVVIEPDAGHPLLEQARATGARVVIGQPSRPRVLLPVIAAGRGCALRRLYALRADVSENEAVLAAAKAVLGRYRPDLERQPHLVARIDDPRHADHWRGAHIGTSALWLEDALSSHESTASSLADAVLRTGAEQLLLCGDSTLALAILRELARRAWEQQELAEAAEIGNGTHRHTADAADVAPEVPLTSRLRQVVLVDRRSDDLRREYLATSSLPITEALPTVSTEAGPWRDTLLAKLDAMAPALAERTAVVVADMPDNDSMYEAGRAARLHSGIPVFVLTSDGAGTTGAIFDRLQPYQQSMLVVGQIPEDAWTRVARHWHECFRLRNPVARGGPRTSTRRPWGELDDFIRQDNILQLRSIMSELAARGRRWVPGRSVVPGSYIELNDTDLEEVARAEHTRWYERRAAAGWRATVSNGSDPAGAGDALVNHKVVPWTALTPDDRADAVEHLRSQLAQLEDVGYVAVVPTGGPPSATDYQRIGVVQAKQLHTPQRWARTSGGELSGDAGDWHIFDDRGDERTVRDAEFRASHEPLEGERWRRTGIYRAWQVHDRQVLRTLEGRAVAERGDWVVEGCGGERWPVSDAQFRRTYRAVDKP